MITGAAAAISPSSPPAARWRRGEEIRPLLHALWFEAVTDMRLVLDASQSGASLSACLLQEVFEPHERGRVLGSAAFLLESDGMIDLPSGALELAGRVVELEKEAGYLGELLAAAIGGVPWNFHPKCLCARRVGSWRPVFLRPGNVPDETGWRYRRPENHVPLCYRCAARLGWRVEAVRVQVGAALWGFRFEAFTRWHLGAQVVGLPGDWDLTCYPLWPKNFGGNTWCAGSGSLECADPRPPDILRLSRQHFDALRKFFPNLTR